MDDDKNVSANIAILDQLSIYALTFSKNKEDITDCQSIILYPTEKEETPKDRVVTLVRSDDKDHTLCSIIVRPVKMTDLAERIKEGDKKGFAETLIKTPMILE